MHVGYNKWSVNITSGSLSRKLGIRFEWVGKGYILSLQVNAAPAVRIILFGWSLHLGWIPDKQHTFKPLFNKWPEDIDDKYMHKYLKNSNKYYE